MTYYLIAQGVFLVILCSLDSLRIFVFKKESLQKLIFAVTVVVLMIMAVVQSYCRNAFELSKDFTSVGLIVTAGLWLIYDIGASIVKHKRSQ